MYQASGMNPVLLAKIKNSLILYVQPIYDSKTLEIVAYEVLSRLDNGGSVLSPPQFLKDIPLGEQYTLALCVMDRIDPIIQAIDNPSIKLHLNFNPEDFNIKEVCEKVLEYKDHIIVEITEVSDNLDTHKREILSLLKQQGVILALDDFGDKNSTYNYIMDKKNSHGLFDMIKIDGSLVRGIDTDPHKRLFVRSIVKSMKYCPTQKIAFEYVENKAIQEIAIRLGADFLQGYYLSEPFDSKLLNKQRAVNEK